MSSGGRTVRWPNQDQRPLLPPPGRWRTCGRWSAALGVATAPRRPVDDRSRRLTACRPSSTPAGHLAGRWSWIFDGGSWPPTRCCRESLSRKFWRFTQANVEIISRQSTQESEHITKQKTISRYKLTRKATRPKTVVRPLSVKKPYL